MDIDNFKAFQMFILIRILAVIIFLSLNLNVFGQNSANKQQQLVPYRISKEWGFSDTTGKILISPKYDEVNILRNGMFSVRKGNNWGLVEKTGKEIIPIKYDVIYDFGGQVPYAAIKKSGKTGYIDTTGQFVVPVKYSWVRYIGKNFFEVGSINVERSKGNFGIYYKGKLRTSQNFDKFLLYPSGHILLSKFSGSVGLLNPEGKIIFPAEYTFISDLSNGLILAIGKPTNYKPQFFDKNGQLTFKENFGIAKPFSEGVAVVSKEKIAPNYGFLDTLGKVVIQFKYSDAIPFQNGIAIVKLNDKYGLIDKNDNIVAPFIFEKLSWSAFPNIIKGVFKAEGKDNYVKGYFCPNGLRTPLNKYYEIYTFNENLAQVIPLGGKLGYINKNLKLVIPTKYENGNNFSEGIAAVKLNGKWGFIDSTGKTLIPFRYSTSSNKFVHYNFNEGIAPVMLDTIIYGYARHKWAYIDNKGKYISGFNPYFQGNPKPFREGVVAIPINWKQSQVNEKEFLDPHYIIINKKGEKINQEEYTTVGQAEQGLIYVCQGSSCGFIDTTGKVVIPLQYQFDLTSNADENDLPSYYFNGLLKAIDPTTKKPIGYFSRKGKKYWQD